MTKGEKIVAGVALAAGVGGLLYYFTRPSKLSKSTDETIGGGARGGASGGASGANKGDAVTELDLPPDILAVMAAAILDPNKADLDYVAPW